MSGTSRTLSTGKVAAALGLHPSTVQGYARDGRIPANTTPGGRYRFDLDEVRDVLDGGGLPERVQLASLDDGPGVRVSMRPERTPDERAQAWRSLRGLPGTGPAPRDDKGDAEQGNGLDLGGTVRRSGSAVASVLHRH